MESVTLTLLPHDSSQNFSHFSTLTQLIKLRMSVLFYVLFDILHVLHNTDICIPVDVLLCLVEVWEPVVWVPNPSLELDPVEL